jgi:hypothetical protein
VAKRLPAREPDPAPPAPVHVLMPTAVYSVDDARHVLRLKQSTIRRELRMGRLRVSRRAGRYYLLGEWLLEWIRGGRAAAAEAAGRGRRQRRGGRRDVRP